MGCGTELSSIQ